MSSLFEMKYVNNLLRLCKEIIKKPNFDPLISIPGVNNNINTVNITKLPLHFLTILTYTSLINESIEYNSNSSLVCK